MKSLSIKLKLKDLQFLQTIIAGIQKMNVKYLPRLNPSLVVKRKVQPIQTSFIYLICMFPRYRFTEVYSWIKKVKSVVNINK